MKKIGKNKIFIQIASYRDPQLIPTLKDCIEKAKNPKNLVFCICWQHDETENLDQYKDDPRFKIIDVPFQESKGACWARNSIQQHYDGEEYTLQLDSHHRFVDNWDEELINMIKDLKKKGHKKPLLTGYIPSYNPENDPAERIQTPWKMNFDRFIPEGAVFFLPASIDDFAERTEPVPARFYSAHFCFTLGKFAVEVQHDPNYYFHGEEISIAVRAFTHGYDLFHPHKVIAWHEYTRKGRVKQWDDDKEWGKRNETCHSRNRKLFEMDGLKKDIDFGIYDFGKVRTLDDYERYSGLCFKNRSIQQYTLDNNYAPNPQYSNQEEYEKSFLKRFKHCIDIGYQQVPETDYDFWAVALHAENGDTIYRKDSTVDDIARYKSDPDGYCKIFMECNTEIKPDNWVVWPHSISKGWCERLTGKI